MRQIDLRYVCAVLVIIIFQFVCFASPRDALLNAPPHKNIIELSSKDIKSTKRQQKQREQKNAAQKTETQNDSSLFIFFGWITMSVVSSGVSVACCFAVDD